MLIMEQELQSLQKQAIQELSDISEAVQLEEYRIKFLGRKGLFTTIMRQLGTVPKEDRPRLGQLANGIKEEVAKLFEEKELQILDSAQPAADSSHIDLTLPGRRPEAGKLHPVTQIMNEVCSIFESLGFSVAEGPDVELDHYNFEALNPRFGQCQ